MSIHQYTLYEGASSCGVAISSNPGGEMRIHGQGTISSDERKKRLGRAPKKGFWYELSADGESATEVGETLPSSDPPVAPVQTQAAQEVLDPKKSEVSKR